jgi:hypothetical protein
MEGYTAYIVYICPENVRYPTVIIRSIIPVFYFMIMHVAIGIELSLGAADKFIGTSLSEPHTIGLDFSCPCRYVWPVCHMIDTFGSSQPFTFNCDVH